MNRSHPAGGVASSVVLLASADGHLVIQKRGAADAVLPSKLTNILAAGGNAVITARAFLLGEWRRYNP